MEGQTSVLLKLNAEIFFQLINVAAIALCLHFPYGHLG